MWHWRNPQNLFPFTAIVTSFILLVLLEISLIKNVNLNMPELFRSLPQAMPWVQQVFPWWKHSHWTILSSLPDPCSLSVTVRLQIPASAWLGSSRGADGPAANRWDPALLYCQSMYYTPRTQRPSRQVLCLPQMLDELPHQPRESEKGEKHSAKHSAKHSYRICRV